MTEDGAYFSSPVGLPFQCKWNYLSHIEKVTLVIISLLKRQVDYTQAFPQADLCDPVYT